MNLKNTSPGLLDKIIKSKSNDDKHNRITFRLKDDRKNLHHIF